jgi:hypothetical protein
VWENHAVEHRIPREVLQRAGERESARQGVAQVPVGGGDRALGRDQEQGHLGESTSNPFEGSANDVPIAQISRLIEIELRELLGETELPSLLKPTNQIIL